MDVLILLFFSLIKMITSTQCSKGVTSKEDCFPTHSCKHSGGHCFTSGSRCNGEIDAYGCIGNGRCMCCIPDSITIGCPGNCPDYVEPICAGTPNDLKFETFMNKECFQEKVKCDPEYANYEYKHGDPCAGICAAENSTLLFSSSSDKTTNLVAATTTSMTTTITDIQDTSSLNTSPSTSTIISTSNGGCPVGFIDLGTGECFKCYKDKYRSWTDAQTKCTEEDMYLAEPSDQVVAKLQKYMVDIIDPAGTTGDTAWLGGKADGSAWVWQRSQTQLSKDNPAWYPGYGSYTEAGRCLVMTAYRSQWNIYPGQPYHSHTCTDTRYTLCQM